MNAMSRRVRTYRVMVLLLAAFYFVDRATQETYAWHEFGWQFRYLTIWALTMSLIAAAMMLTRTYGGADRRGAGFVSVTAVVNAIVVASYWRLYFQDPALVNGDNRHAGRLSHAASEAGAGRVVLFGEGADVDINIECAFGCERTRREGSDSGCGKAARQSDRSHDVFLLSLVLTTSDSTCARVCSLTQ